jgi:hypothetical protein
MYQPIGRYREAGSASSRATEVLVVVGQLDRPIVTLALEQVVIGCCARSQ